MRYSNRQPTVRSLVGSFDQKSYSHLIRNSRGMIERIREEGRIHWKSNAEKHETWERYCNDMLDAIHAALDRRHDAPLEQALRDAIRVYEHSEGRLIQMMHAESIDESARDSLMQWIEATFRALIYAITSIWIDDKIDHTTMTLDIDLATGKTKDDIHYTPPTTPRKYRKRTRGL